MDFKNFDKLLGNNFNNEDDFDDDDLEAELQAIVSGNPLPVKGSSGSANKQNLQNTSTRNVKASNATKSSNRNVIPSQNKVAKMKENNISDTVDIQNLLKGFDIEKNFIIEGENEDDENVDENDDNLLSELRQIVGDTHPQEIKLASESNNIKPDSFLTKKPLIDGTSDLNNFSKPSSTNFINQSFFNPNSASILIPDPQTVNHQKPICVTISQEKQQQKNQIKNIQLEYKKCALKAKNNNDKNTALAHYKIVKQLDTMLNALDENQDVDMSTLPPFPQEVPKNMTTSATVVTSPASSISFLAEFDQIPNEQIPEMSAEEAAAIFNAPKSAVTVLEALEQRLEKFQATKKEAELEQNDFKARRLGRIVTKYQNVIKDYKAGKPVEFDDLPCPPGFLPIPTNDAKAPEKPENNPVNESKEQANIAGTEKSVTGNSEKKLSQEIIQPKPTVPSKQVLKKQMSITANKQLNYLMERKNLFREAALEAKKRGELEQAKEYLRFCKGFDPLIEATKNGLPIDATSIPTPPQLNKNDFVILNKSIEFSEQALEAIKEQESQFGLDSHREELFLKVQQELRQQIEMCDRNKEYFLKLGDVASSSKFEKYSNESKKDLNMLVVRWKNGQNVPSFRTETRTFSIVVSNPEVGLNEVQVEIVRAFDLPGKSDLDTYIKLEFPVPTDKPQSRKTKIVYNTLNPEFNETIKFEIDRKYRGLTRIFKRHALKLEIFSKSGFLRNDVLLGTALVKMSDFETKCTIHECYPLTEGRKQVNGRLEVKVKIREPLLAKQVEEISEKWIIFS